MLIFPSSIMHYLLLALVAAASTVVASFLVPRRWGWKAFPLIVPANFVAETILVVALGKAQCPGDVICILAVHFNSLHLLFLVAVAAIVFEAIRRIRRARPID